MKVIVRQLEHHYTVTAGDSFRLYVDGREVHRAAITGARVISHWALVEIGNCIGYFIGDHTLEQELRRFG